MKQVTKILSQAKTQSSGTASAPACIPEHWIDKLFMRFANIYRQKWIAGLDDETAIASLKREWQIQLAKVDAKTIAPAIDLVIANGSEWPPTLPEFIAVCRSVSRDNRMNAYETKQIGNHNPEFAKQQLHKIMLKLKPVRLNPYHALHGMRAFV